MRTSILKTPKASELSPQVAARAPMQERTPRDAVIQVHIRTYTNDASAFVHTFPEQPMWQVQVVHAAVPSVTFDIVRSLGAFLAREHEADPEVPGSLADLYAACHVKLVVTDSHDPDGVGFVKWRVALYAAGAPGASVNCVVNLLDLLPLACADGDAALFLGSRGGVYRGCVGRLYGWR